MDGVEGRGVVEWEGEEAGEKGRGSGGEDRGKRKGKWGRRQGVKGREREGIWRDMAAKVFL